MQWEIQPLSSRSSLSEHPFTEGDTVLCLLLDNKGTALLRYDIRPEEVSSLGDEFQIVGKWTRVVKSKNDELKESQKQMLQSSEELFISLFDEDDAENENKIILKQILALLLERKRIIKPTGKDRKSMMRYLHVKTKKEYDVSLANFPPEKLMEIEGQLQCIIV